MKARPPRRARVRALAKINLDLRVLHRRADGYHELRTVFQTISLADTLELSFTPGAAASVELDDPLGIPDNLVERAARLVMEAAGARGAVHVRLDKRIPSGAGLGGGSSDAAAVLLALPALAGRRLDLETLSALGARLGSDVPFFLLGGTAVGIGRGTEMFPLPDGPRRHGLLVVPDLHVSTPEAYRLLDECLTPGLQENKILGFQSYTWGLGGGSPRQDAGVEHGASSRKAIRSPAAMNDFEEVVFRQHPCLAELKARLVRAGAATAGMSGSGSALFGLFPSRAGAYRALRRLEDERTFPISLVSRVSYRALWRRALAPHIEGTQWPPQSRYKR